MEYLESYFSEEGLVIVVTYKITMSVSVRYFFIFYYIEIEKQIYFYFFKCRKMGLEWKIYDNNFDNIFNALLSLFVLSTFDNWYETMNVAVNSHNEEEVKNKY